MSDKWGSKDWVRRAIWLTENNKITWQARSTGLSWTGQADGHEWRYFLGSYGQMSLTIKIRPGPYGKVSIFRSSVMPRIRGTVAGELLRLSHAIDNRYREGWATA